MFQNRNTTTPRGDVTDLQASPVPVKTLRTLYQ